MVKYFCKSSHSSLSDARCIRGLQFPNYWSPNFFGKFVLCLLVSFWQQKYLLTWQDEHWHLRLSQRLCAEISCRMGDLFYLEHHPRSGGWGTHRVFTTCLFPGSFKMNLRRIAPFAPKHYHITLFAFRKKTQNLNALEHLSHERSL